MNLGTILDSYPQEERIKLLIEQAENFKSEVEIKNPLPYPLGDYAEDIQRELSRYLQEVLQRPKRIWQSEYNLWDYLRYAPNGYTQMKEADVKKLLVEYFFPTIELERSIDGFDYLDALGEDCIVSNHIELKIKYAAIFKKAWVFRKRDEKTHFMISHDRLLELYKEWLETQNITL